MAKFKVEMVGEFSDLNAATGKAYEMVYLSHSDINEVSVSASEDEREKKAKDVGRVFGDMPLTETSPGMFGRLTSEYKVDGVSE